MKNDIVWTTEDGKELAMHEITTDHLHNIIRLIEKRAEKGIRIISKLDEWLGNKRITRLRGDAVKERFKYDLFFHEAVRRHILYNDK